MENHEDKIDPLKEEPGSVSDAKLFFKEGAAAEPATPIDDDTLPQIAGFWLRVFAYLLDLLIFVVFFQLAGWLFRDFAFSLGPWGRLIGYGLIVPYWAFFNSEKGSGQTIGKQLMKIVVVDQDNNYLTFSQSLQRALIIAVISLLNRWQLPLLEQPILAFIATFIIFGGGLAFIYGLVFNRVTRQGLHDLLIGSYVVMTPLVTTQVMQPIPYSHKRNTYGLLSVGMLIALISLLWQGSPPTLGIIQQGEWDEILALQASLADNDDFFGVGVNRVNRTSSGSQTVEKRLSIEVWSKTSCEQQLDYCQALIDEVARQVLDTYGFRDTLTGMRVSVYNRFDFGLAFGRFFVAFDYPIPEWQRRLQNAEAS
ncbi:MAG: RDD family protein [Chloroflexota bacterium]